MQIMFILNEYQGSKVNLNSHDGNLYQVLLRISEIARRDGFNLVIDQRIKGKIKVALNEPWNLILLEILAGLDFFTIIERNTIVISAPE
jgi:hypothetical protein